MDYRESIQHLLSLVDYERAYRTGGLPRYDLTRMEEFLRRLGNPHLQVPTVHLAGTKGKGSTAAMIASALTEQGYVTGLYTSPHLHAFRERIRMGLIPITAQEFASLVEGLSDAAQEVGKTDPHGGVTTFEMLTAMAFAHFARRRADIQVLEVGLGGRLDATNMVPRPLVCVITALSLDHTAILGNTVAEIAREKAGIIKPGVTVVTAPQLPEALAVIQEVCETRGATLVQVAQEYAWERTAQDLEGQSFTLRGRQGEWSLWIPLLGRHQMENAATAVTALDVLRRQGVSIAQRNMVQGLESVRWPGRLEVLQRDPLVVVDGAHNPASMGRLRQAVGEDLPHRRLLLVLGVSADKDFESMVEELARLNPALVVATRSRHPRALPTSAIARPFQQRGVSVHEVAEVGEATRYAISQANEEDMVLVTGSLFAVAEAREQVKGIPPELYPELPRSSRVG
ncbi:MAG: bifunctional folylpolyglutamate synthase/dihydrofolate synthase [Dehalococcoidia bacterium]|nr:bifunctional folylpolyglutamate synthase/dihydrofolate synthase [Dehalococcoidia bacterium]